MSDNDLPSAGDQALVQGAQAGDMGAFEELVARHRDKIYARAYSMMRNEEEAIDLSQEAWVKAWQRLKQFQGESSFGTWMTRIVINLCLDQLRRRKRQRAESIDELDEESGGVERQMPVVTVNPTEGLERAELRKRIDVALGQLSHAHRTVLVLHEFEGMEYKEIAKTMACSIGTVMSRLFYARRKMAVLLADLKKKIAIEAMNQELELKLQAHFDGELPAGEAGEVTDLIASDAGARALLAELQNTRGVMASFEADVKLPESREFYWSKVERDIRHLQKPEPAAVSLFAQWRWWLIRFGAVAAMVLVFFAIGPRIGLTGPGIPEMETALADSEAFTYRDYQQGVTLVWLAYPAENEFADTDPVDTLN